MDDVDIANMRRDQELENRIAEHQYQLSQAGNEWPYGLGYCKNCAERLDDTRPYCDEKCRDDHWDRIKAEKRNGKYRGG